MSQDYGTPYAETEALLALIEDADLRGCAAILNSMSVGALLKLRHAASVLGQFAAQAGVNATLRGRGSQGNIEGLAAFHEWERALNEAIAEATGTKSEQESAEDRRNRLVGLSMLGAMWDGKP